MEFGYLLRNDKRQRVEFTVVFVIERIFIDEFCGNERLNGIFEIRNDYEGTGAGKGRIASQDVSCEHRQG